MLDRLLERGKTSGREDDNAESIKKRFSACFFNLCPYNCAEPPPGTYKADTMPVVEYYSSQSKVAEVRHLHQLGEGTPLTPWFRSIALAPLTRSMPNLRRS